jgi:hypothetical protein
MITDAPTDPWWIRLRGPVTAVMAACTPVVAIVFAKTMEIAPREEPTVKEPVDPFVAMVFASVFVMGWLLFYGTFVTIRGIRHPPERKPEKTPEIQRAADELREYQAMPPRWIPAVGPFFFGAASLWILALYGVDPNGTDLEGVVMYALMSLVGVSVFLGLCLAVLGEPRFLLPWGHRVAWAEKRRAAEEPRDVERP